MAVKKGNRQEEQGLERGLVGDLAPTEVPDPEVMARPAHRRFTKEEKLRILEELDRCPRGQKGAIYRREGIYSSTVAKWRKQRAKALAQWGATSQSSGPEQRELEAELAEKDREIARLKQQLERAELIIEAQKKISALWGLPTSPPDSDGSDSSPALPQQSERG
jgi:transposase-like protein